MNSRPDPCRSPFPLQSQWLNDHLDSAFADIIALTGLVSPSGTLLAEGLYDRLDETASEAASGFYTHYVSQLPIALQLRAEWDQTGGRHGPLQG